jgi:hypothetical protein
MKSLRRVSSELINNKLIIRLELTEILQLLMLSNFPLSLEQHQASN